MRYQVVFYIVKPKLQKMKNLLKMLFAVSCTILLVTCSKSDRFGDDWSGNCLKSEKPVVIKEKPVMVTLPFDVHYLGNYVSDETNEQRCGSYPGYDHEIVDGAGWGTLVGKSWIHFDFCVSMADDPLYWPYGNDVPKDSYGKYYEYIIADNGDSLYINCSGRVISGRLPNMPVYVNSYWKDPFEILGGTGQFRGATGKGMTDDYNSDLDSYSHHHWVGTITIVKDKEDKCRH